LVSLNQSITCNANHYLGSGNPLNDSSNLSTNARVTLNHVNGTYCVIPVDLKTDVGLNYCITGSKLENSSGFNAE
jgi:hypothetical protein